MSKHTPGPWKTDPLGGGIICGGPLREYSHGESQSQVALATLGNGIYREEREANARLIAAAPELYENLLLLYTFTQLPPELDDKIKAVLKKVEGRD